MVFSCSVINVQGTGRWLQQPPHSCAQAWLVPCVSWLISHILSVDNKSSGGCPGNIATECVHVITNWPAAFPRSNYAIFYLVRNNLYLVCICTFLYFDRQSLYALGALPASVMLGNDCWPSGLLEAAQRVYVLKDW